ncbi:hypothetical protein [Streptomyces sp. Ru72]|uniref:hypothetical protein n=1 Tax=Streptomyces sp. Ru72 TaxID=2080747 RepID=UPI0035BE6B2F
MDEIAAAADVAVGTLYRHSPTKTRCCSKSRTSAVATRGQSQTAAYPCRSHDAVQRRHLRRDRAAPPRPSRARRLGDGPPGDSRSSYPVRSPGRLPRRGSAVPRTTGSGRRCRPD